RPGFSHRINAEHSSLGIVGVRHQTARSQPRGAMPTMLPLGNATVQHRWATQRCCARIITMRFTPECGRSGSKMASRGLSRHPTWIPINGLGAIDSGGKLIVTEHVY